MYGFTVSGKSSVGIERDRFANVTVFQPVAEKDPCIAIFVADVFDYDDFISNDSCCISLFSRQRQGLSDAKTQDHAVEHQAFCTCILIIFIFYKIIDWHVCKFQSLALDMCSGLAYFEITWFV